MLEGSADQLDIEYAGAAGEQVGDLAHARGEEVVAAFLDAAQLRGREFRAQAGFERGRIVAERDRAQAALGGGDQGAAKPGV